MKAVVLTVDSHLEVARLVVESYRRLWPAARFVFRIPYFQRDPSSMFEDAGDLEFVWTRPDIRNTMAALLDEIREDEFVFWCIDDRYPIAMVALKVMNGVFNFIAAVPSDIVALRFTAPNRFASKALMPNAQSLDIAGMCFREQSGSSQNGFYMPQFVRAAWLRRFLLSTELSPVYTIREFHQYLGTTNVSAGIYAPDRSLLTLGESTIDGALTSDCQAQLTSLGLSSPDLPVTHSNRFYG